MTESFEDRLTEQVRQHFWNDSTIHAHWMEVATNLCKMAHNQTIQWESSEYWTTYQAVVYKLADSIKDWLEIKTNNTYSLNNTIVSFARAFINYEKLAHDFVYDAVQIISYETMDREVEPAEYLGNWNEHEAVCPWQS